LGLWQLGTNGRTLLEISETREEAEKASDELIAQKWLGVGDSGLTMFVYNAKAAWRSEDALNLLASWTVNSRACVPFP
jgi:hypothetical protein